MAIVWKFVIAGAIAIGAVIAVKSHKVDVPTLLVYAQYGVDADCAIGTDALAANICAFGTDAITAAKAAIAKDPVAGKAAAKQILVDAEKKYPAFAPYVDWLIVKL